MHTHSHIEDCCPKESTSDDTYMPSENRESTEYTHECSQKSGCITKKLNCRQEHNAACGYSAAKLGTPCTFVCEICNRQDNSKPSEPKCICKTLCTADAVNDDCPACGTKYADLTKCVGKAADKQTESVQAQIDFIPTVKALAAMTAKEQQKAYSKLNAAYETYSALNDGQKTQIAGIEIFESLFAFFDSTAPSSMTDSIATINDVKYLDAHGRSKTAHNVTVVDGDSTTWFYGWYVVKHDVTIKGRVFVEGHANLILADNAKLTVKGGIGVHEAA